MKRKGRRPSGEGRPAREWGPFRARDNCAAISTVNDVLTGVSSYEKYFSQSVEKTCDTAPSQFSVSGKSLKQKQLLV